MDNRVGYSNNFKKRSAWNKKKHLEKVKVHNLKTMFIKELAGALILVSMAGGIVGMVKAMVDDYSRNKHNPDNKSYSSSGDVESQKETEKMEETITESLNNLEQETVASSENFGGIKR